MLILQQKTLLYRYPQLLFVPQPPLVSYQIHALFNLWTEYPSGQANRIIKLDWHRAGFG